ncbi:hypothetical protein [Kutzneria sp. NPDC052558]|uniref:hypothetical protein n=1 Tax=Kutzneria sp. NPDC052558 TaxID=3364121 RepID=UPI0037C53BD3
MSIERAHLGALGPQLGRGAQAVVSELPSLTLPDAQGPLVYKEYRTPIGSSNDLRGIVTSRLALDPSRRAMLDAMTVWPLRVVEENGVTRGIVMRRVPNSFADRMLLPGTGRSTQSLREVQNLFIDPTRAKRLGRPVPDLTERLRICRDFAGVLSFLHTDLGVAFGDINPKNELYRLTDRPTVLFLDCDGVRRAGQVSGARQLNTPDWVPPANEPLSQRTDQYKLGLFILRCLCPGDRASTRLDPAPAAAALDAVGRQMLVRALSDRPPERPTAWDWHVHLSRLIGEHLTAPILTEARLEGRHAMRGQPVLVRWQATDAVTVEVRTAGHTERMDGRAGAGTTRVFLTDSPFVLVVAHNEAGQDARTIGPVPMVAPPPRVELPAPMPRMDWPPPAALVSPHMPTLPPLPAIQLPTPFYRPQDLVGSHAGTPTPALPPVTAMTPPFDVTALIMNGPRVDFGQDPPALPLPDIAMSTVDPTGSGDQGSTP